MITLIFFVRARNSLNFAFRSPARPSIPSTSRPNDRLGILRDRYARRSCVSSSTYARPPGLFPPLSSTSSERRGPMEFQMRVRLRVRNCQNEFSSGRARVRIIRGPPRGLHVEAEHHAEPKDKERANGGEIGGSGRDREIGGRIGGETGREESTGPKQGHQKIPRTTNHRGGLRLPQMPAQRREKEKRTLLFASRVPASPPPRDPRASVPLVLSVIARPGRSFSRRPREDLSNARA